MGNFLKRFRKFFEARPLITFFSLLIILLSLTIAANLANKPKEEPKQEQQVKTVDTFKIGTTPRLNYQAKVEKLGVLQIVATQNGIVSKIHVKEGQTVQKGTNLVSLGTNYQGSNPATVQKQIAQAQYTNVTQTFDLQKDIIAKQREIANKTDASSDELRNITSQSVGETQSLIDLNQNIIDSIDANITALEAQNTNGQNDALILQSKQLKSQFLAGTNQAQVSLRQAQLQSAGDKPAAQLSNLARDLSMKQLDLQEKSLELAKQTSTLSVKLAQINEAGFFPTAPQTATVEKIHVRFGQAVNPGSPLVTLASSGKAIMATAIVPAEIAKSISALEPSYLKIVGQKVESSPYFISQEATDGQLYSARFLVPEEFAQELTDGQYISVEIPITTGTPDSPIIFVPLDAVHQTQDQTILFTLENGSVFAKQVTLGRVKGNYVAIAQGLSQNDTVILDRSVTVGQKVSPK